MAAKRDVVIIGGGHNGLVTAFYLAKAGRKPLVLERRPVVGGAAITDEFHPGFRVPTLAHTLGPLRADVMRDMALDRHGLSVIRPEVRDVSLGLSRLRRGFRRLAAVRLGVARHHDAATVETECCEIVVCTVV